jgi:hypothetical protein
LHHHLALGSGFAEVEHSKAKRQYDEVYHLRCILVACLNAGCTGSGRHSPAKDVSISNM